MSWLQDNVFCLLEYMELHGKHYTDFSACPGPCFVAGGYDRLGLP